MKGQRYHNPSTNVTRMQSRKSRMKRQIVVFGFICIMLFMSLIFATLMMAQAMM